MNTYNEVKNRIFQLLEKNNLSIHSLAIRSGVAPSTIKNILYGKSRNPGIVTIKLICDGLEVSVNDFFDTPAFRSVDPEDVE
jgi:transcriptional regulator with XRE-family HTH domain